MADVYSAHVVDNVLIIPIMDPIGGWWGVSPRTISAALRKYPKKVAPSILIEMSSPGGDTIDGTAIHSILLADGRPIECHVYGIAASMASVVMLAAGKRVMYPGSMVMIHEPWTFAAGGAAEMEGCRNHLEKVATSIVDVYAARTHLGADEARDLMK
jgi:ATP-dependent protease ClpP protease subunit